MMVFNKKTSKIVLISIFLLFLCMSTVCASDITVTNVNNDNNINNYSLNQINEIQVNDLGSESVTNENMKLVNLVSNPSESNEKYDNKNIKPTSNLKSLNETILNAKNKSIVLDKDYKYSGKDDLIKGIILESNLVIDGQGHSIDGAGVAHLFNVNDNVTIKNLIIKNTHSKNGGAIEWYGTNGTISNCTFQNNTANKYGGALYLMSNVTISNSIFNHNTAKDRGGAIYAENETIIGSTFQNNTAYYCGGALYLIGDVSVLNSTFKNNTCNLSSGAIHYYNSIGNMINCTFINCNNTKDKKAINTVNSNIHIENCTYDTNNKSNESNKTNSIVFSINSTKFYNGDECSVCLTDNSGNAFASKNIIISIAGKTYNVTTDENGLAKIKLELTNKDLNKSLTIVYNFVGDDDFKASNGSSKIKVIKIPTIVTAKNVSYKKGANKYFTVTVKNKLTKKVMKNLTLNIKVFTGKKSKTYTIKTNNKGIGKLPTKKLTKGKHKVTIETNNNYYNINSSSKIIVIK